MGLRIRETALEQAHRRSYAYHGQHFIWWNESTGVSFVFWICYENINRSNRVRSSWAIWQINHRLVSKIKLLKKTQNILIRCDKNLAAFVRNLARFKWVQQPPIILFTTGMAQQNQATLRPYPYVMDIIKHCGTKLKPLQYTIIKRNGVSYMDLIGPIQSKTRKRKAPGRDLGGNKLFLHRCSSLAYHNSTQRPRCHLKPL